MPATRAGDSGTFALLIALPWTAVTLGLVLKNWRRSTSPPQTSVPSREQSSTCAQGGPDSPLRALDREVLCGWVAAPPLPRRSSAGSSPPPQCTCGCLEHRTPRPPRHEAPAWEPRPGPPHWEPCRPLWGNAGGAGPLSLRLPWRREAGLELAAAVLHRGAPQASPLNSRKAVNDRFGFRKLLSSSELGLTKKDSAYVATSTANLSKNKVARRGRGAWGSLWGSTRGTLRPLFRGHRARAAPVATSPRPPSDPHRGFSACGGLGGRVPYIETKLLFAAESTPEQPSQLHCFIICIFAPLNASFPTVARYPGAMRE